LQRECSAPNRWYLTAATLEKPTFLGSYDPAAPAAANRKVAQPLAAAQKATTLQKEADMFAVSSSK
jgi:hypothetical protein